MKAEREVASLWDAVRELQAAVAALTPQPKVETIIKPPASATPVASTAKPAVPKKKGKK